MVHPWHNIPAGNDAPEKVHVVVEVPLGSTIKYELDKRHGLIKISHVLYPPVPYPGNYGFIPRSLDEDGDPLDAIVIMRDAVSPLTLCTVRPVGVVNMEDSGENDDKIICVLLDDPVYDPYESFEALPEYERKELEWFFEEYQKAAHDAVSVKSIEGKDKAHEVIKRCLKLYEENFA